jgi:hypothetical protein
MDNLGIPEGYQLDRIDNEGHYEPGNLRWSTPQQNMAHYRRTKASPTFHKFRQDYPGVLYADSTLRKLLCMGLTPEQIAERWNLPSCKPKGVYGTFSQPDHFIVSLCPES